MKHWMLAVIGISAVLSGCAGINPQVVNEEFAGELIFRKGAYHLKPEDVISITTLGQEDFNEPVVVVTRDGYIDTRLGRFFVRNKTIPEVQQIITKGQKQFPENPPNIVVQIQTMSEEHVFVRGMVRTPSSVVLLPGMTAMEAIISAGGELPTADTNSVYLVRRKSDWQRVVREVDLDLLEEDLVLLPRDIVYVPRHFAAAVANFLDQYIYSLLPLSQLRYYGMFSTTMGF